MIDANDSTPKPKNRRQNKRKVVNYSALAAILSDQGSGAPQDVIVNDLSYTGVRIEGDALTMRSIQPDIDSPEPHQNLEMRLTFLAPDAQGQLQSIVIQGSTVYSHPISSDRATIGLEFIDVEQGIGALSDLLMKV